MEKEIKIASALITVEKNNKSGISQLNHLLSNFSSYIIARQGLSLPDKDFNIITIVLESDLNTINSFAEKANNAQLLIFNMQGTLIKTYSNLNSGQGEITISSHELNAGMYMYSLIANGKVIDTKRMILTK